MPTKKELLHQVEDLEREKEVLRFQKECFYDEAETAKESLTQALIRETEAMNSLANFKFWLKDAKEKNAILKDALRREALRLAVQAVQPQSVTQTAGKYLKFLAGEDDD